MFKDLWSRLAGKPETKTANLYDLTDEQVKQIEFITRQDGWRVLQTLWTRHQSTLAEQLLVGDLDTLLETRGAIKGYREATLIVANILQAKEQRDVRKREQSRVEAERSSRVAAASRFSPFAENLHR